MRTDCPPGPREREASPEWITDDLLRETLETWQPYYRERLTVEDAKEMLLNVGRLSDAIVERKT